MKRYCLISHTHWDREWYLPFENFRMRLVDLIDNLLDILDADPDYRFHLDAQTIVLDDYLAIRPEKRDILREHIRLGRILVGPWYVQNDFHLTDGEATVRNLMIGTRMAKDFGGSMPIGYAADQFGLITQLPQILVKAGLHDCVFGRGFDRGTTEFFWESEDGSKVLCEHMKFWYNNAQRLSPDPEGALTLVRDRGRLCAAFCATGNYLLMNGVDHLEAQEDLSEIMAKVRPMLDKDEELFQDTLPEFMKRVRREVEESGVELKTFRGEFRDNGADNVLTGTLSSRTYLKQANASAQVELERDVEPVYALLAENGVKKYPHDYMYYLWKLLIENHPHDSICGCSVDAVHEHMMDRFKRVHENASDLSSRAFDELSSHLDPASVDGEYRIILFNPTSAASSDTVTVTVDIMKSDMKGGFVITENGKNIPFTLDKLEEDVGRRILSPINLPGEARVCRCTVTLDPGVTEGFSYRVLAVKLTDAFAPEVCAKAENEDKNVLENEYIKAVINSNGSVDITDKRNGEVYSSLLTLEDTPDRGELYVYVPGEGETVTSEEVTAEIKVSAESTTLRQVREVSYSLSTDREATEEGSGRIDVLFTLALDKNSDALDVRMVIDNALKNHRLRALMPTGLTEDKNIASQPYDVIVRDKVSRFRNDATHPSSDFVAVENAEKGRGLAVLHHGLYEYEHTPDDKIALTVLRCTGRITGGWAERNTMTQIWITPGGQCIGRNTAHFALLPYSGDHVKSAIAARAQSFLAPVKAVSRASDPNKFIGGRPFVQGAGMPDLFYRPIKNADKVLPVSGTMLKLEDETIPSAMIVTALKEAESGLGTVVRMYNSTSETVEFKVSRPMKGILTAKEISLLEDDVIRDIPVCRECGKIRLTAKPKEIITLLLR